MLLTYKDSHLNALQLHLNRQQKSKRKRALLSQNRSLNPINQATKQTKPLLQAFVKKALFQFFTNCPPTGGKKRRTFSLFASEKAIVPLTLQAVLKHLGRGDTTRCIITCLLLFQELHCFFASARQPACRRIHTAQPASIGSEAAPAAFIACCQQPCLSPSPPRTPGEVFLSIQTRNISLD